MPKLRNWDREVAVNLAILHSELAMLRKIVTAMTSTMSKEQRQDARRMIEEFAETTPKFAEEAFDDPDRATQYQSLAASHWIALLALPPDNDKTQPLPPAPEDEP